MAAEEDDDVTVMSVWNTMFGKTFTSLRERVRQFIQESKDTCLQRFHPYHIRAVTKSGWDIVKGNRRGVSTSGIGKWSIS